MQTTWRTNALTDRSAILAYLETDRLYAPGDVIYLTFDDGPTGPRWTPQVLEVLARYDARATFFVLGQQAKRFPDLIEAEVEAGHSVVNHTFDHHTLDGISRRAFFEEVQDTEAILGDLTTRYLRPPYGATDAYDPGPCN